MGRPFFGLEGTRRYAGAQRAANQSVPAEPELLALSLDSGIVGSRNTRGIFSTFGTRSGSAES